VLRIEFVPRGELFARESRPDGTDERMADEFCVHAAFAKECLFKGKNAESLYEAAADQIGSPRAPGPELWADVVDVADAEREKFAGEAEMEAGEVREYG
jgi:hypothetical protein